jgi:DnaJ family protein C protein 9
LGWFWREVFWRASLRSQRLRWHLAARNRTCWNDVRGSADYDNKLGPSKGRRASSIGDDLTPVYQNPKTLFISSSYIILPFLPEIMSSVVKQAFGTLDLDLYLDVLQVSKDCSPAKLRKAYYQQALKYHPDKNLSEDATLKFQAISWVYDLLKNPERRADYDETGHVPRDDELDVGDEDGSTAWKDYFDTIFGKLSTDDIDQFAMKYKMSEEEEQDVLKHYEKYKGNLVKMLEYVMLSEERDVPRWVEDYIQPALSAGKIKSYTDTMNKTLKTIQKRLEKQKDEDEPVQEQTDETETEESDEDTVAPQPKAAKKKAKPAPKKAKPTKAKKGQNSQADLIAAIRNKNKGGSPFAALGARYGVSMDEDPLDDAAFAKIQSKFKKKK